MITIPLITGITLTAVLPEMLKDHESPAAQRVMEAMLQMKKLEIATLERAFAG